MKLKDIMTNDVSSVSPKDPIIEAAKVMQQRNVGCIPVCDNNNEVKGILTDRDIVIRVVAEGRNPKDLDVSKVMSTELTLCGPDMNVEEAAEIMAEHQIRRLPVVQNKKLIGIVSIGDLATHNIFIDEASFALKNISQPSRPLM
ncbi:MAG: CBS domain-containing protein [Peptococcales bacterium]|jgi:CBS domain-containing protein